MPINIAQLDEVQNLIDTISPAAQQLGQEALTVMSFSAAGRILTTTAPQR
ncbi:hypothetical protein SAMN04487958_101296 [Vreelandella subterranea]|uniref:Uncharacterized protein n=1 Tax=Vreelandella subterranea TaxID=416874 RepID=A0A1H9PLJ2_9GAMM|nr:hypothetical protein SAMN04487958_101296 [Halomonas subterranea]